MLRVTSEAGRTGDMARQRPAPQAKAASGRQRAGWLTGLERLIRYRLHVPLKRSRQTPAIIARGVMVGTVWACTPLFGLHMLGAFLTWVAARKLFGWDFSLIIALAWTWVTNVFTVLPAYYLFYLTGQVMLGRLAEGAEAGQGFAAIAAQMKAAEEQSLWEALSLWISSLVSNVGLPLSVGWIPWSVLFGWIAYRLTHGFVVQHRKRRARRQAQAQTQNPAR
jgi:uncharacterized protein (DUF2062 family)